MGDWNGKELLKLVWLLYAPKAQKDNGTTRSVLGDQVAIKGYQENYNYHNLREMNIFIDIAIWSSMRIISINRTQIAGTNKAYHAIDAMKYAILFT